MSTAECVFTSIAMCFTASVIFRVSWRAREARPCVGVATTGVFTVLLPICACSLHNDQGCQQARQQRSALPSRLGNARPPQPPQDGDLAGAGTAALRRCAPDGGCEAPAGACLSSQISRASGLPQRTSSPPPPPPSRRAPEHGAAARCVTWPEKQVSPNTSERRGRVGQRGGVGGWAWGKREMRPQFSEHGGRSTPRGPHITAINILIMGG